MGRTRGNQGNQEKHKKQDTKEEVAVDNADDAIIFYDPEALKIKNRIPLDPKFIKEAFANKNIEVLNSRDSLNLNLFKREFKNKILLMMSSGSFGDLNWKNLKNHMLKY